MVQIKEIDADNVFDVCELTTNQNGIGTIMEEYLCCNAISIAESKYFPEMHPNAIYNDEELIGFFMYRCTEGQDDTATICRFMIDCKFQNRGLGRKAFQCILSSFKMQGIKRVFIMLDDTNEIAKKLYLSFGFKFTGKIDKEEYYYELEL